jgi:ribonuclease BN (tRNA processing enzyme)
MHVEFLGTAGYHPSETRHTSCVFVPDAAPDAAFVLDAGTGFFRLIQRPLPAQLHIFLTHAHLDHVVGLTFLLDVLLGRQCKVTVYGMEQTLDTIKNDLFDSPLFPLPFTHELCAVSNEDCIEVSGVRVSTFPLTHPGGSLAYRFDFPTKDAGGDAASTRKSLAYITDTAGDGRYIKFICDVDLLIHERNFSDDLHEVAVASGHCTSEAVTRVVRESRAKRIALTHFNPRPHTDPADEDALHDLPDAVYAHDGLSLDF